MANGTIINKALIFYPVYKVKVIRFYIPALDNIEVVSAAAHSNYNPSGENSIQPWMNKIVSNISHRGATHHFTLVQCCSKYLAHTLPKGITV